MTDDKFPTEPPTRPNSESHRANRMLARWHKLSHERKKLVEQLVCELEIAEHKSRRQSNSG